MNNNKILVVIDTSYLSYYITFGAVKIWSKSSPHSNILKNKEETDQSNLPDLTKYRDFCTILEKQVIKRIDTIFWILKSNNQQDIDLSTDVDIFFCLDEPLKNNWRKKYFPEYKAQRKMLEKQFNTSSIIKYIRNVVFKKINLEDTYGCQLISSPDAEADDVIAILIRELEGYSKKIIIASDKDFLQLENMTMYDMMGKEKTILPKVEHKLTPKSYILFKSIFGDTADNIPKVFSGYGEKRCLKLMEDIQLLKEKLHSDPCAAEQFLKNKKIIDFTNIPQSLIDDVLSKVKIKKPLEEQIDLSDLMSL